MVFSSGQHSLISQPSSASWNSPFSSCNSETTDNVPDIVHIRREGHCGVSAAVVAYVMKMFLVSDVIGLYGRVVLEVWYPKPHSIKND